MHKEILTTTQIELLDIIKLFKRKYYMVGGTAIALHIGHRYSIDFDMFTYAALNKKTIKSSFDKFRGLKKTLIWESGDQIHYNINDIKLTFYQYPYQMEAPDLFEDIIKMPTLLDLAGMQELVLGGRAKWK